jgi:twinkle protein
MSIIPHDEIRAEVIKLHRAGGLKAGDRTGWPSLDKLYSVALGQWTLVTGVPGSGKSEWLDALMVNLAKQGRWQFIVYSPENWPLELHHSKIVEKFTGKPFNPGPTPRVDEDDLDGAEEWMRDKFMFARPNKPHILSILDECMDLVSLADPPNVKTGVVIDPWNQLEHHRPAGMSETEYISETLTYVIERVRAYRCHLWLVAHPRMLQRDKNGQFPIPRPYDISGSAHWYNKSDNCLCVHRDQSPNASNVQAVEIYVQKVRFKHCGHLGQATLRYDRITGRYHEMAPVLVRGTEA